LFAIYSQQRRSVGWGGGNAVVLVWFLMVQRGFKTLNAFLGCKQWDFKTKLGKKGYFAIKDNGNATL
jgi:hypothetical protein